MGAEPQPERGDSEMNAPNQGFSIAVAPSPVPGAPVCAWGDVQETIANVRRIGYSAVEILLRHPEDLPANFSRILGDEGIALRSVLTGPSYKQEGLSLSSPNSVNKAITRVIEHIDLAAGFGASVVLGWMLGPLDQEGTDVKTLASSLKRPLARCLSYAHDKGVTLLVEPVNRYEPGLIRTAQEGVQLCEDVGGKLGLVLDMFHMNIEESDLGAAILSAAHVLGHLQIADSNREAPGRGHLDFPAVAAALSQTSFTGTIGVEVLPFPTADVAGESGLTFLRNVFSDRGY